MNYQTEEAIKRFEKAHENVTITLEILPTEEKAREIRLKQLRSMIPTGSGPDVYLLPVSNILLLSYPQPYTYTQVEALFTDVTQAMYNGNFADIHTYYDADEALGKEAFNTTVMDAGVIDGARYVLPLRYNLPLIYTDPQRWNDWGLTQDTFDAGIAALMETGLVHEKAELFACGLPLPDDMSLLPQIFDYEKSRLLLTQQELTDYMRLYQRWHVFTAQNPNMLPPQVLEEYISNYQWYLSAKPIGLDLSAPNILWDETRAERRYSSIKGYIISQHCWQREEFPLYSGSLKDAMSAVSVSLACRCNMTMLPLRSIDGSLAADITYYGAVSSGCAHPELAYEFLRTFLTDEFQWDGCRPRMEKSPMGGLSKDPQRKGMVEDSWPVRTVGSVVPLWDNVQYQYLYVGVSVEQPGASTYRSGLIQECFLTDEDIPALTFAIDEVRFPIVQEEQESLAHALSQLNDEDGNPTDVDIDALAQEVLLDLWWHLAEG